MTAAEYCQRYNGNRQAGLPKMLFFVNINVAKLIRKLPFRPENSLFFYHEAHEGTRRFNKNNFSSWFNFFYLSLKDVGEQVVAIGVRKN